MSGFRSKAGTSSQNPAIGFEAETLSQILLCSTHEQPQRLAAAPPSLTRLLRIERLPTPAEEGAVKLALVREVTFYPPALGCCGGE